MKSALWKVLKRRILAPGGGMSVCAWCRRAYTRDMILKDPLTDEQYREIKSHGICGKCKADQLAEARAKVKDGRR